ncbi:MAG TPA: NAD(P)-dependent oxidoreductase [Flavobacterium sp.]|nr:NAD(P)-dependent oxidoreductase [Flavobacterium sp.]
MNQKTKTIALLGCGWLGLALAKSLLANGYFVKGSTTSKNKLPLIKTAGILAFQIQLEEQTIKGNIEHFLEDIAVLIIAIPPKLRSSNKENFVQKIKNLIPHIKKSAVKKVIFISSTSVYGECFPFVEITEDSITNPDTESGKQLVETEYCLLSNIDFKTIVVRFGGLIGHNRHPVHYLAGKQNLDNPDAPVNLIHQKDCILIIEKIVYKLLNNSFQKSEVFNAVAPQHPSRKDYYTKKAAELKLVAPSFVKNTLSKGKIISSKKMEQILKYSFQKEL